jgi:hypothetical protein
VQEVAGGVAVALDLLHAKHLALVGESIQGQLAESVRDMGEEMADLIRLADRIERRPVMVHERVELVWLLPDGRERQVLDQVGDARGGQRLVGPPDPEDECRRVGLR